MGKSVGRWGRTGVVSYFDILSCVYYCFFWISPWSLHFCCHFNPPWASKCVFFFYFFFIIIIYNYPALTLTSAPGSWSFSMCSSTRTMGTRQWKMSAAKLLGRQMIMMGSKRTVEWDLVASIKSLGQLFLHHIHHGLLGRHREISGFSSTWMWFNEVQLCSIERR